MNTFPLPSVEVADMHMGHSNPRRDIWEAVGKRFAAKHFFIHGGSILGDHCHIHTEETFWVTVGTGHLYIQDIDPSTHEFIGEMQVIELVEDMVVNIQPFCVHTFVFDYVEDANGNEIRSEMLQFSISPFSDEDTISLPLAIAP